MSKKINVDAIGSSRSISLKHVSDRDSAAIPVRTIHESRANHVVPDEYRTFDRGRRGGWGFLFFLILLFVATVGGFYYWNYKYPTFQHDSVKVSIIAPKEVVSGGTVEYVMTYENTDVVALKSVQLDIQWPDGFYYDTSSVNPTAPTATTWNLGPLDAGQKREFKVSGQLIGEKDKTQTAIFRLSYRPDNINSDFEIKKNVDILINDAQIDLQVTAADKILAGQEVEMKAVVTNLTKEALKNLDIEVIVPKDLTTSAQDPKLTDNHWTGDIAPDKPLNLSVKAKVAPDADGVQSWVVEVSQKTNDQTRKLMRKELQVTPVKPDFGIDLKINGQGSDFSVEYGKTLNYQLKLTNKSTSVMTDVKVTALLDSDVIDRKTVQSNGIATNQSIVWTKDNIPELASLQPNQELLIAWKADVLGKGTVGRATVDTVITVELEGLTDWRQNSPVFVVSVGDGLAFTQNVYWQLAGEKVGSGNLPPVTNERTVYLVAWSLDSGSQDFDSVNVSTTLPPKVTFVSQGTEADEGTLKYDETTNRLEWQINNFSTKLLPLKATFQVKLVPLDEDKGTIMTVMNPATVVASGAKTFTTKSFSISTAQVIANQEGDIGTVVE